MDTEFKRIDDELIFVDINVSTDDPLRSFCEKRTPENFEVVMTASLGKVRGVIYNVILNYDDTEDLCQETFVHAYRNFDSYKFDSSFSTWLCGIAIKKALNLRRKNSVRENYKNHYSKGQNKSPISPVQSSIHNENKSWLDQAMEKLPTDLRVALVLLVIEEIPGKNAAKMCACSRATLYWRLHKARNLLKKWRRSKNG